MYFISGAFDGALTVLGGIIGAYVAEANVHPELARQLIIVTGIVITMMFLFMLGAFLGNLMKEIFVYTGLRFVIAGLATAIILILIGGIRRQPLALSYDLKWTKIHQSFSIIEHK